MFTSDSTKGYVYLVMFYYSLIIIGLGELAPANEAEFRAFVLTMLVSSLIYFFIFSEIISLLVLFGLDERMQQSELDQGNSVMEAIQMEFQDIVDIREFILRIRPTKEFQIQLDQLLADIPHSCQMKLLTSYFISTIKQNRVTSKFSKKVQLSSNSTILRLKKAFRWRFLGKSLPKIAKPIVRQN